MPQTPSAVLFLERYPAFESVGPGTLGLVLVEATAMVSDDWAVADQAPAIMAYAAHLLAMDGFGKNSVTIGGQTIATAGPIDSIQVGDVRTHFSGGGASSASSNAGGASSGDGLSASSYGRRFIELRRRNVSPIMVLNGS